jgi:hemolysin activation/secretion protein
MRPPRATWATVPALVIIGSVLLAAVLPAHAATQPLLSSAVISGSSVYDAPQLFAIYREQLGRPLTEASASAVAAALARRYERDGYSRPDFQIDQRPMAAGILRIEVFEARFTRVLFSGSAGPYEQRLAALGAQIRDCNPVRPAQVQRALQKMRALPGLSVTAETAPDETVRNGFVLTLSTTYRAAEALVRISNRGSREIGPVFVDGQGLVSDLLGKDEKLGAQFTAATDFAEYHAAGAFAEVPVDGRDTHLSLFGLHESSTPSPSPLDAGASYTRTLAVLRVTHPLPIGPSGVALAGGLDVDNQLTDQAGAVLRDDRLRIADLSFQATPGNGAGAQYAVALDLRRGLNALGSELHTTDLVPDPRCKDFMLTRLQLTGLFLSGQPWLLRLDTLAQLSGDALPYTEQLKIGGEVLGRGFEVAEVAGDSGVDSRLELRRELTHPVGSGKVSLYGYYDYGRVWSHYGSPTESAAIAGAGLAFSKGALTGSVELAQPLIHPDVDGSKSPRAFFEIAAHF